MKLYIILLAITFSNQFYLCVTTRLRDACYPLQNSTWVQLCKGSMSKEIKIKYKDQLTVVGTPYKIFRLMHVDYSFMVSFFNSPILNCSWINVNDDFTIKCRGKQPILLRQSKFYCFGYGLYYLADLLALCMDQQDSLTKIASQGSFSVVHLSYIPPLKAAQAGLNVSYLNVLIMFLFHVLFVK
ncbi:uncharacterized protein LOC105664940 [Ceratitis capitata]|uniref:uncharacterized protein LOC105664940 n=1 Tax=Ceratitis capitata TaxID=7213 RepID=UPI000A0F8B1B|nr:uncharacterized protein LOC105664940 [Ceratitis capitata]